MTEFWYNLRRGTVEEGPQSPGVDRAGPFETRAEAEHAPELIRERAAQWAADEADGDR